MNVRLHTSNDEENMSTNKDEAERLLFICVVFITVINGKIYVIVIIVHGILGCIDDKTLCNLSGAPREFLCSIFNLFELMNGLCNHCCGLGERPRNVTPAVVIECNSDGGFPGFQERWAFTLGCIDSCNGDDTKVRACFVEME